MPKQKNINACIIGASGYTGVELLRLLSSHPKVEVKALVADSNAGKNMAEIYPHLSAFNFPKLKKIDEVDFKRIDVAFCCLPHATTQSIVKNLPKHLKIIDLSADFRLYDTKTYQEWYGREHNAPELQKKAIYGLSELFREPVKTAELIACPGCYPTSAILPLAPLLRRHAIEPQDIIIDSKSGITGAGRSVKQDNLFAETNDGIKAYNICKHRHMPEIEQILTASAGSNVEVFFTPQIVPMNRGILSTIYVKLTKDITIKDAHDILKTRYKDEPFVHVLPLDEFPATRHVYGSNHCIIGITRGRKVGTAVIISAIDNLIKGASGQAVQNMNIVYGFDETTGLEQLPLFP